MGPRSNLCKCTFLAQKPEAPCRTVPHSWFYSTIVCCGHGNGNLRKRALCVKLQGVLRLLLGHLVCKAFMSQICLLFSEAEVQCYLKVGIGWLWVGTWRNTHLERSSAFGDLLQRPHRLDCEQKHPSQDVVSTPQGRDSFIWTQVKVTQQGWELRKFVSVDQPKRNKIIKIQESFKLS